MRNRTRASLVAGALALALALPAAAQDWVGRGRVQGQVTDPEGEPIEGASVTLWIQGRPETGPEPLATNKKGRWSYLGLTGGTWAVKIEKEGFVPSEGALNVTEFGRNPDIDVELRPIPKEQLVDEEALAAKKMLDEGNELLQQEQFAAARGKYEEALGNLDEEYHPMVLQAIAQTYMGEDNPQGAIEALDRALVLLPNEATLLRFQAQAYYEAEQFDRSIAILETLVEQDNADQTIDDTQTVQLLVDLLVRGGREEDAQKYLAMMPEGTKVSPETLLNTGIDAFNAGNIDDALKYFDQTVQENPDLADAYYYRGLAHLNKEMTAEASADFKKLLELAPDHPKAEEAKQFLSYLDET